MRWASLEVPDNGIGGEIRTGGTARSKSPAYSSQQWLARFPWDRYCIRSALAAFLWVSVIRLLEKGAAPGQAATV
jgi:hypothetical protein